MIQSIDLTKVPLPPRLPTKTGERQDERHEYSSREMKPADLLLRDLLRAHSTFLLHHDSSLSALFMRSKRPKFVAVLSRYWDLFLSTWSVMLHGNPARDILGGINIAASGELGVGVGEEDRGSGEREVLEGLVGRIEGLVDLVVSKFGEPDLETESKESKKSEQAPWLGTGQEPGAEDGAIFLGTGALSRRSVRDVSQWMEDLYTWGDHAYGVIESPTSIRRAKARKTTKTVEQKPQEVKAPKASESSSKPPTTSGNAQPGENPEAQGKDDEEGKLDKMVSYLKLGYGSYWTIPGTGSGEASGDSPASGADQSASNPSKEPPTASRPKLTNRSSSFEAAGHYLIGLKGEIEEGLSDNDASHDSEDPEAKNNARTVLRTINVELEAEAADGPNDTAIIRDIGRHPGSILAQSQVVGSMVPGYHSHDLAKATKLRVVVYVNKPFIFTFLFQLRTDSLAWDSLYRSLHYQLAPLRKPLLASTRYRAERPSAPGAAASSIYDLVWDPDSLAVHSTVPNIPEHYEAAAGDPWSRADALSTHLHLLNIYSATRPRTTDLERTQKTNRGWWIVWTRLLERSGAPGGGSSTNLSTIHESASDTGGEAGEAPDGDGEPAAGKEIFLLRRASDHVGFHRRSDSGAEGVGRVAQGIGVDTRRYVEELLSLL